MGTVIIFVFVTILCAIATFRSMKQKNVLALGFAGLSFLVFGMFTAMTIVSILTRGGGIPGGH
jgi:hypothetical protein